MDVCSIVLADDHVMFRKGVKRIIEETSDLEWWERPTTAWSFSAPQGPGAEAGPPGHRHAPPPGSGSHREIKKLYPRVKIIFLTMHRSKEFLHQPWRPGPRAFSSRRTPTSISYGPSRRSGRGKFISPLLSNEMADLALREQAAELNPLPSGKRPSSSF